MLPFSDRLKAHTSAAHARLDAHPFSSLLLGQTQGLTAPMYGLHLQAVHKVWATALEALCWADQGSFWRQSLEPRLHWLEADLQAMGLPALASRDTSLLGPRPVSWGLGVCYVLEGSALGGTVIAKALHAHGLPPVQRATRFYTGRGQQTGAHWREVKRQLDLEGATACFEHAVEGANALFEAFSQALWVPPVGFVTTK